jgi:hypothetical protein
MARSKSAPENPSSAFAIKFEKEDLVEFKIRLHYDGMWISQFFRYMMEGYLKQDPDLLKYLTKAKKLHKIHSKQKRHKSYNLVEKGIELEKDFAFSDEEVDDIYDLLENDPDLCWFEEEDFMKDD